MESRGVATHKPLSATRRSQRVPKKGCDQGTSLFSEIMPGFHQRSGGAQAPTRMYPVLQQMLPPAPDSTDKHVPLLRHLAGSAATPWLAAKLLPRAAQPRLANAQDKASSQRRSHAHAPIAAGSNSSTVSSARFPHYSPARSPSAVLSIRPASI